MQSFRAPTPPICRPELSSNALLLFLPTGARFPLGFALGLAMGAGAPWCTVRRGASQHLGFSLFIVSLLLAMVVQEFDHGRVPSVGILLRDIPAVFPPIHGVRLQVVRGHPASKKMSAFIHRGTLPSTLAIREC